VEFPPLIKMKKPSEIIKLTEKHHSKLIDRKLNYEESWRTEEFSNHLRDEINNKYGKQDFKVWKEYTKKLIKNVNKLIKPDWKLDGGFYVRQYSVWRGRKFKGWKGPNPILSEPLNQLIYGKLIFDILFPNAKIYIVHFGNLTRDTKYFKKNQKVRYYKWGHNSIESRGGWLGFNRKTKKYEVHNIYSKYIKNIRFKLTGHVDISDSFTYY